MKQDRTLRTLRALMLGINLALVLYYSLLRGLTTLRLAGALRPGIFWRWLRWYRPRPGR